MLIIKDTVIEDVSSLAPKLRADDRKEVAAGGFTPVASLFMGFKTSYICKSVFEDNKIIGMCGITTKNCPQNYCAIWFLGSDESEKYPITFVKEGKKLIKEALKNYFILNFVWSGNINHIKYIERIGLIVDKTNAIKHPSTGELFYPFYNNVKEV